MLVAHRNAVLVGVVSHIEVVLYVPHPAVNDSNSFATCTKPACNWASV